MNDLYGSVGLFFWFAGVEQWEETVTFTQANSSRLKMVEFKKW